VVQQLRDSEKTARLISSLFLSSLELSDAKSMSLKHEPIDIKILFFKWIFTRESRQFSSLPSNCSALRTKCTNSNKRQKWQESAGGGGIAGGRVAEPPRGALEGAPGPCHARRVPRQVMALTQKLSISVWDGQTRYGRPIRKSLKQFKAVLHGKSSRRNARALPSALSPSTGYGPPPETLYDRPIRNGRNGNAL